LDTASYNECEKYRDGKKCNKQASKQGRKYLSLVITTPCEGKGKDVHLFSHVLRHKNVSSA